MGARMPSSFGRRGLNCRKPHLWPAGFAGMWHCAGKGRKSIGTSVIHAYSTWYTMRAAEQLSRGFN